MKKVRLNKLFDKILQDTKIKMVSNNGNVCKIMEFLY